MSRKTHTQCPVLIVNKVFGGFKYSIKCLVHQMPTTNPESTNPKFVSCKSTFLCKINICNGIFFIYLDLNQKLLPCKNQIQTSKLDICCLHLIRKLYLVLFFSLGRLVTKNQISNRKCVVSIQKEKRTANSLCLEMTTNNFG